MTSSFLPTLLPSELLTPKSQTARGHESAFGQKVSDARSNQTPSFAPSPAIQNLVEGTRSQSSVLEQKILKARDGADIVNIIVDTAYAGQGGYASNISKVTSDAVKILQNQFQNKSRDEDDTMSDVRNFKENIMSGRDQKAVAKELLKAFKAD